MSERSRATRRERRHAGVFEPRAERRDARPAPAAHPWVVPVLGAAFFVSGAAGLMHEVVWTRLLGHVFGTSSLAVSTVLAAFMGGLALGSWWIGSRSARLGDQRRAYALLDNMYVEFHTIQDTAAAAEDVGAELERYATPIETALPDAAELLARRERLGALVDGIERLGRASDRYRALLTASARRRGRRPFAPSRAIW